MTHSASRPKINLTELARTLGKDRSYITKVFNGTRDAPLELALEIFEASGCKIGLLKGKPDKDIRAARRLFTDGAAA